MSTDSIAELASQLQAFINTKHPFAGDLDPVILQSIESYAPPPTSSPGPASTSQERRSRSVARPPESPPYPVEWADSRSHLRSAVRHFQELLKHRTASRSYWCRTGGIPVAGQSPNQLCYHRGLGPSDFHRSSPQHASSRQPGDHHYVRLF